MRKLILGFLVLAAVQARAQEAGKLGLGMMIGSPIGFTGKYWLDGARAADFGLGAAPDGDFVIHGDFLLHDYGILPQPVKGKLGLYGAIGARLHTEDDPQFGIRTMGGVNYWIEDRPIELFAEAGPVFELSGNTGVDVDGGVGVRIYFDGLNRK